MKITKPGKITIDESGTITIDGFQFDGEGAPHTLSDYAFYALDFAVDLAKSHPDMSVHDCGNCSLNGVKGPLPEWFKK